MATKPRTLPLNKRGLNFEMIMWIFTRLSALAMYAFILFGMIGALIMGARNHMNFADEMRWGFMPNSTHVQSTNVPDLAPWATIFWRLTACALLLVASAHGMHGLGVIADDYIPGAGARKIIRLLSIVMLVAVSAIGIYVLWTSYKCFKHKGHYGHKGKTRNVLYNFVYFVTFVFNGRPACGHYRPAFCAHPLRRRGARATARGARAFMAAASGRRFLFDLSNPYSSVSRCRKTDQHKPRRYATR